MEKELLVSIGYTIDGVRKDFKNNIWRNNDGYISCSNEDLVMLDIPEGVKKVYCWSNSLTELIIPDSLVILDCEMNNITRLVISENSMLEILRCDKNVKGLETLMGKADLNLY